ncbi:hypothetical protein E3N88_18400 [Mikania micrantha]|uniref:Uncharacterized protein n=1 Tax=Mikania micrantha TaxID=192012 RepID=A0A5N6NKP4_9ASTR|nr:hypothetical protein E3N88_18400 [Mikania micrantha]
MLGPLTIINSGNTTHLADYFTDRYNHCIPWLILSLVRNNSGVILAKEVAASKLTIFDITKQICDAVQARAEQDKNHVVILLPEGLMESIPEVYALLQPGHRQPPAAPTSHIRRSRQDKIEYWKSTNGKPGDKIEILKQVGALQDSRSYS